MYDLLLSKENQRKNCMQLSSKNNNSMFIYRALIFTPGQAPKINRNDVIL